MRRTRLRLRCHAVECRSPSPHPSSVRCRATHRRFAYTRYCFMSRRLYTNQYYGLQTAPLFGLTRFELGPTLSASFERLLPRYPPQVTFYNTTISTHMYMYSSDHDRYIYTRIVIIIVITSSPSPPPSNVRCRATLRRFAYTRYRFMWPFRVKGQPG